MTGDPQERKRRWRRLIMEADTLEEQRLTTHEAIDIVCGLLAGHCEVALAHKVKRAKLYIADVPITPFLIKES